MKAFKQPSTTTSKLTKRCIAMDRNLKRDRDFGFGLGNKLHAHHTPKDPFATERWGNLIVYGVNWICNLYHFPNICWQSIFTETRAHIIVGSSGHRVRKPQRAECCPGQAQVKEKFYCYFIARKEGTLIFKMPTLENTNTNTLISSIQDWSLD